MVERMYKVTELAGQRIKLGRVGEHNIKCIQFDVSDWLSIDPNGFVVVHATLPVDPRDSHGCTKDRSYLVKTTYDDGIISWPITRSDTHNDGEGSVELIMYSRNGAVLKSVVAATVVTPSIAQDNNSGHNCGCHDNNPNLPWIDQVAHYAMDAQDAAERAEDAYEAMCQISIENTIPEGGEKDQVLAKLSDRDGDFGWINLPEQEVDTHEPCKELVISEETLAQFPRIGDPDVIYKAELEGKLYQWNAAKNSYEPLTATASIEDIIIIHGGNAYGTA